MWLIDQLYIKLGHGEASKIGQVLQKAIIIVMWKMLTSKSISTPDLPKMASVRGLHYGCLWYNVDV